MLAAILAAVIIAGVIIVFSLKKSNVLATWVNYDGTQISAAVIEKGKEAVYAGETPSRAEDDDYTYEFTSWEKNEDADGNVTYTAVYDVQEKEKTSDFSRVNVGDTICFGSYEQDNNTANGKEAIEWIVLDIKDGKALLLSKYGLDAKPYNDEQMGVTWETCTLRTWLNGEFMTEAFGEEEQDQIAVTEVTADANPEYDKDPGNDTQDKVFLLSITEAEKFFTSDSDRKCEPTAYAIANGAYKISSNGNCWWWLRSPGYYSDCAARVDRDGSVRYAGNYVHYDDYAIRPALRINLEF